MLLTPALAHHEDDPNYDRLKQRVSTLEKQADALSVYGGDFNMERVLVPGDRAGMIFGPKECDGKPAVWSASGSDAPTYLSCAP